MASSPASSHLAHTFTVASTRAESATQSGSARRRPRVDHHSTTSAVSACALRCCCCLLLQTRVKGSTTSHGSERMPVAHALASLYHQHRPSICPDSVTASPGRCSRPLSPSQPRCRREKKIKRRSVEHPSHHDGDDKRLTSSPGHASSY